jgi:hypothetical protein
VDNRPQLDLSHDTPRNVAMQIVSELSAYLETRMST